MNSFKGKRRKKPEGAGYKTGIYLMTASSLGLILGFIVPWAKITGDEFLDALIDQYFIEQFWFSDIFFLLLLILFTGVTILLLNFFEDIEVLSSIRSSWVKLGLEKSLIVFSILLIFLSLYYLGLMIVFNNITIRSDDITAILYTPAPLMLAAIGLYNLYIATTVSKKESKVIQFETRKRKKAPVKKKVKTPVKKGGGPI